MDGFLDFAGGIPSLPDYLGVFEREVLPVAPFYRHR